MKPLVLASVVLLSTTSVLSNELCGSYQNNALPLARLTAATSSLGRGTVTLGSTSSNAQQTSIQDDNIAVTITGHVKKYKDVVLVQTAAGNLTERRLSVAANTEVRFWKINDPSLYISAHTDEEGNYQVELSNGQWQGEACGSGVGFSPSAWKVSLADNKLLKMQEIALPSATLNVMNDSLAENEELVVSGSGFGCNGSLVFEFNNNVDNFGHTQEIEYNHQPIIKNDFCSQTDQQIRLPMPTLMDTEGEHSASSRLARLYYVRAGQRSNTIFISEFNHQPLNDDFEDIADIVNNSNSVQDFTGNIQDVTGIGTVVGGPATGGFFGGVASPVGGGFGQAGFFQGNSTQTVTGFQTSTFGVEQVSTDNINFDFDAINLGVQ